MSGWVHVVTEKVGHVSCSDCCCTTPTPDAASPCEQCRQTAIHHGKNGPLHPHQPTRCLCGHAIKKEEKP